jgi:2,4-dienoyl-CoA reductase-like NADH-dependent reductase (Old Yellow Enzyme family)
MFAPLFLGPDIGSLPNRVIMGSMHTGLEGHSIPAGLFWAMNVASNDDHRDMTKMAMYFEERAKGGVGLMGEFATRTHLKIANCSYIYIYIYSSSYHHVYIFSKKHRHHKI